MTKSGWCSAPAGAQPAHEFCRWETCTCECHDGVLVGEGLATTGLKVEVVFSPTEAIEPEES